jgi:Agrobacterium tumefaciens protein Atu4866
MRYKNSTMKIIAPLVGAAAVVACQQAPGERAGEQEGSGAPVTYVGMWVTADNHIRQELLPNGRYDEARGGRESAYTGRYRVNGNHIEYADDTGFTADGEFEGDILHHGGYVFYREDSPAHRKATGKDA